MYGLPPSLLSVQTVYVIPSWLYMIISVNRLWQLGLTRLYMWLNLGSMWFDSSHLSFKYSTFFFGKNPHNLIKKISLRCKVANGYELMQQIKTPLKSYANVETLSICFISLIS